MSTDLTPEEIHDAVDRAVLELLESAGVEGPPVDAVALAERHLGLAVPRDRAAAKRGEPLSPEQEQAVAARAVADHLRPDVLRRLGLDPAGRRGLAGASLAALIADCLLVPTAWFRDEARGCGFDLFALKKRFATASHELLAWRMLDLDEPCVITIVDNDQVSRRRGNAVRVGKELAPAERRCLEQVQRYSRPSARDEGGWRVQGWPIHQADWKREVLRSVPPEE